MILLKSDFFGFPFAIKINLDFKDRKKIIKREGGFFGMIKPRFFTTETQRARRNTELIILRALYTRRLCTCPAKAGFILKTKNPLSGK
jgi:hypothetical protein